MGQYYIADLVPFAVSGIYEGDSADLLEEEKYLTLALSCGYEDLEEEGVDVSQIDLKGWEESSDTERIGKNNELFTHSFKKGEFKVYSINESEHSSVGYIYLTICANDEASLKQFIKDFDIGGGTLELGGSHPYEIQTDYVAKQVV